MSIEEQLQATGLNPIFLDTYRLVRLEEPDLPFEEAAKRLKCAATTVARRVSIVERKLKNKDFEHCVTPAEAGPGNAKSTLNTEPEKFAEMIAGLSKPSANAAQVAREMGLSPNVAYKLAKTLESDLQPLGREVKQIRLDALRDRFGTLAQDAIDAITPEKLESANARDLAVIAGIAGDKWQLLRGQPTQRMEISDRRQMDEMLQEILREAKRRHIEIDVTPTGEVLARRSPYRNAKDRDSVEAVKSRDPVATLSPG